MKIGLLSLLKRLAVYLFGKKAKNCFESQKSEPGEIIIKDMIINEEVIIASVVILCIEAVKSYFFNTLDLSS